MGQKKPVMQGITVKKSEDFSEWYNQVVQKAELADYAPVHGFMVIRPLALGIWKNIQNYFDSVIAKHGVENAYFPLLIPESFFKKEQAHAEGFAPEVAWIERDGESEERVAIRPSSETIIGHMFSRWVRSHRDLPLKLNQWTNIVRWEIKQTKLFLRTREFLWQEGHCIYASHEEELEDTLMILKEYQKLSHDLLAVPVIAGKKTEMERFPGANETFGIEGFMPDGKALQMGTSHDLGQNFAKAFDINFMGEDEQNHLVYQNSWGFSTRLLGAIVMVHADDKGLVLPPRVAPVKVVIVPILFEATKKEVLKKAFELKSRLSMFNPKLDTRENYSPGWKFNEWELKGIPIRIELGPKDLAQNQCVLVRRDTNEKKFVPLEKLEETVEMELEAMHHALFKKAKDFLDSQIVTVETMKEFKEALSRRKLVRMLFCGKKECEQTLKDETTATSRCIPLGEKPTKGVCVHCGKEAEYYTLFSKAY
jgi:prolyl-tRNA synthetase